MYARDKISSHWGSTEAVAVVIEGRAVQADAASCEANSR